ncbi:MAG: hypothetical protein ACFE9C_01920 [Candidatus Hodarchaeota archaeon]
MSFNSEGYFCEGEVEKDWQFKMEFGRIILSDKDVSFIKKSNINLTEIGTNFNKFNEGFKIPLLKINKVFNLKKDKIYVVIIETTDGYIFSATFAEYRNSGKKKSIELTELINRNILKGF